MTDKQHEQDLERVSAQNTFTDFTRHAEHSPKDGGGFLRRTIDSMVREAAKETPYAKGVQQKHTDFEDSLLNDMIDLVEQTNPEDLESSGKALWDARDAITEAAKELDGHIEKVHWVGESGEAFRKWGRSLVTNTYGLSDFAGGAGDQITAAAVGLAAVRKAMPPRDTRPKDQQALKPGQLPAPKQVEGNAEYAEAVRVEKNRQEAINQMNRLSSYYAVANEQLVVLQQKKTPEFESMPDVGVPKPTPGVRDRSPVQDGGVSAAHQASGATGGLSHQPAVAHAATAGIHGSVDAPTRPVDTSRAPAPVEPDIPVGTTIDSVGTLPPVTSPIPGDIAPTVGVPGGGSGANNGLTNGYVTPVGAIASRNGASGPAGLRGTVSAQGRTGAAGVNNVGSGRTGNGPIGQAGRPTATGQSIAKGVTSGSQSIAKGVTSGAKALPVGQGVTGGTAKPAGTTGPRPRGGGATGAAHANGVVGGRPVSGSATPSKSGPRVPRGTVIGSGAAADFRSAAQRRPGQSGVFGGPTSAGGSGSADDRSRGGAVTSGSITGSPASRNSAANAERNGMTRGGAGLVRGPGGREKHDKRSDRDRETSSATHPTGDEEPHLPTQQRRDVPPVVN
jgi:hypothetical protein